VQEDTDALLKSITVCAIMGTLSVLADIAFCSLWAREVSEQSFRNIYCTVYTLLSQNVLQNAMPLRIDCRRVQWSYEVLFDHIHNKYVREGSIALLRNDSCRGC
jgi:hypothetical protein